MTITLIEPNPDAGFEYPYYFHVPAEYAGDRPLLVEPTNTGVPSDEFAVHRTEASRRARGGVGRRIADELGLPFLHPVFPRPFSDPVDWTHSTHQLCARTLRIAEGPLARIDRQLLAMVDDARARLSGRGIVPEEVVLNGFSASAAFVNRFSVLHPDRVCSVSAGGVNGIVTLPRTAGDVEPVAAERGLDPDALPLEEVPLYYPVGVADLEDLTGEPFDPAAFCEVNQFVYMGDADEKDVLLWPDAWTDPERRMSAILTYGPDVHDDRFPYCASVYEARGVSAIFRTYPETGHDPTPAIDDVVTFHERSIAGADPDEIADDIGGNPV